MFSAEAVHYVTEIHRKMKDHGKLNIENYQSDWIFICLEAIG